VLTAIVGILLITTVAAAQKRIVKGYVKDSSTQRPLANVLVSDEFANILTHTDGKGYFNINLKDGQIIFFDAPDYHYDTLRLATMTPDTVTVYLAQLPNELAAVTVTTKGYSKYQQDSIKRRQAFVDDAGPKTPTFAKSNTDAGLAVNLDMLLKKKERDRKNAYKEFDKIEQSNYVDARFPRDLVASYTGLRGDELSNFIEKYRPSYKWLRSHATDDDVFYYINEKLKDYMRKKQ
jgi:hypothetical protein